MERKWKQLIFCLALPLAVGGLATLLSGGMADFKMLNKPPLTPLGWIFPVVWTALYLVMGYSSWRILQTQRPAEQIRRAWILYAVQLGLNFLWPIVFFGFGWYLPAFFVLLALWGAVLMTMHRFSTLEELAGDLWIPYLLWVTYAGYLNIGIYILN